MEKVHFQQEQMLAELKDLAQKGVFSQTEIKQIMKKRTAFERTLIRRVARKGDFLRYIAYEMSLESLRRKRVARLNLPPSPPSISDYALVRRQFYVFERALKKFKSDVALWIQYINVAKQEGARTLVGRITARALQLHPNSAALYILAAAHELAYLSPSAARSILQRGIRLNGDSVEMWTEYVKMELGFIESLRRRWEILGIGLSEKKLGKAKERYFTEDGVMEDGMEPADDNGLEVEDDEARAEIMNGAIVKSVLNSAAKALPRLDLFASLRQLISTYPSPPVLRSDLLDYLHRLLHSALPNDPNAIKMYATRSLTGSLQDEDFVEKLQVANEEILASISSSDDKNREDFLTIYAEFVEEWFGKKIDDNLRLYLLASLKSLIRKTKSAPSAALLSTHLRLLSDPANPSPVSEDELLDLARRYTTRPSPTCDPRLWLARLNVERKSNRVEEARSTWRQARSAVHISVVTPSADPELQRLWFWGLDKGSLTSGPQDAKILLEDLLRESLRDPSSASLHEQLLLRYIDALVGLSPLSHDQHEKNSQQSSTDVDTDIVLSRADAQHGSAGLTSLSSKDSSAGTSPPGLLSTVDVKKLGRDYLPTARVWATAFDLSRRFTVGDSENASAKLETEKVLRMIYHAWRELDVGGASLAWGMWLASHGKGREANELVGRARVLIGGGDVKEGFERAWREFLDEKQEDGDAYSD